VVAVGRRMYNFAMYHSECPASNRPRRFSRMPVTAAIQLRQLPLVGDSSGRQA
jgi:hypothetical protein